MSPMPGHNGKFLSLEAGRGIAALLVVMCHAANGIANNGIQAAPLYITMFSVGSSGVDFFFVLSGFIILFVHYDDINRPDRLRNYLASRFIRVVPIYWIALVMMIAIRVWMFADHLHPSLADVVWSALLQPTEHDGFYVLIAWTLQYEIVFYGVFAILLLNKRAGMALFAGWIGWIAFANITGSGKLSPVTGLHNLEFFGGLAAAYVLRNHRLPMGRGILGAGVSIFVITLLVESSMPVVADRYWVIYGFASVLIVLGAVEAERRLRLTVPAPLIALGSASYSIYLFHYCVLQALASYTVKRADQAVGLAALTGAAPAPAVESYLSWLVPVTCFVSYSVFAVVLGMVISRRVEFPLIRVIRSVMSGQKTVAGSALAATGQG